MLEWIAKIEGYQGPVARRNALTRALAEIREPADRRRLIAAAREIEVSSVLEKVDELKTLAARRRHLEAAILELRTGEEYELKATHLRQLEERMRGLA